ncbi:MAG TPA: lysophospholipid acyltransferase family protein [Caldimonas sp.]|nr:lysophospholipid acyltransferase family protein [Caldimonas sp.]HEX4234302.1 lysophospholipid acyltransferase family protein [Caldimonas sp.]
MDLRDFEPARAGRRLTGEAAQSPALGHRLRFVAVLVQLGAMSLAWNLLAPLLAQLMPRAAAGRLGRVGISFIYRSCWATAERFGLMELDSSALDTLRDEPGGLIVAANHPSMLDALVVVARLPRGVCVMKADLLRNIFLGGGARLAQYIRNDVGRGMVRDAVASLREGNQLVLFPEGTRTVTTPINAFKPGITLIAHLAEVPIQTVVIETFSPYLTKGWPLLKAPPVPVRVRLRLGRRFAADPDHRALLQRIERYFAEELGT